MVEGDVGKPLLGAPPFRDLDCVLVEVDADGTTLWADECTHKETDVTDTAADIEHIHVGTDPGCAQHSFGDRSKQLGLLGQSTVFGTRPTERVVGVLYRRPQSAKFLLQISRAIEA